MLGLATPFQTQNYGTKLQAFAMQSIFAQLGYDVEVINYVYASSKKQKLKAILSPSKISGKLKSLKKKKSDACNPVYLKCIEQRNRAFDSFVNKNIRTTRAFSDLGTLSEYSKRYDAVICGSDQIWLPLHIKKGYYSLSFVPNGVKRIAYAPSFGISQIDKKDEKMYSDFLGKFDFISCRENSGCKIINTLTSKKAQVVLDPTLMVERDVWDNLSGGKQIVDEKYVFCYFIGTNPLHRQKAKEIADTLGCKTVCLPHINSYVEADENYADYTLCDVDPAGFVNLIKNAEYICTDSFHASVFSTIFQKQYFVFERFAKGEKGSTNTRLVSLLENLGLKNRLLENEKLSFCDIFSKHPPINYDDVYKKLKDLKISSGQYIASALGFVPLKKHFHIVIDDKTDCCGCGACADICPKQCIEMTPDSEGFVYPIVNKSHCIDCGLCVSVCPVKQYKKADGSITAFAAYSRDEKIRMESTSGGIFTHLAEKVIENGGTVISAAFDGDFTVRHICIDSPDELYKFRSSKYVQSNTLGIYKKTRDFLDSGKKVMFCGTPCQIRALKTFLKKDYDNLICVDLFCHGVPSQKSFEKYLENANTDNKKIENISFRDKRISWEKYSLTIKFSDGEKSSLWKHDPYARAFGFSLINRPICSVCRLKSFPRVSDITLGDLWKINEIFPEMNDHKGISFVLLNSSRGIKLFNSVSDKIVSKEIKSGKLKEVYPVMGVPVKPHKNRAKFFEQIDNAPFGKIAMKYSTVDKIHEYKVLRSKILNKLGILTLLRKIKGLL